MEDGKTFKSKREATEAIRSAFEEVKARAEAGETFAKICHLVHQQEWLTDTEISNAIGGKPSRNRIQQLRKKVRENDNGE